MSVLQKHLASLRACAEACKWAGERTPQQAWDECERLDWLIWWAAATKKNSHSDLVRAVRACVGQYDAPRAARVAMCADIRKILTCPMDEEIKR